MGQLNTIIAERIASEWDADVSSQLLVEREICAMIAEREGAHEVARLIRTRAHTLSRNPYRHEAQ